MTRINFTKRDGLLKVFWSHEDYRDFLNHCLNNQDIKVFKTQAELAKLIDVSSPFVNKILAKKSHLSPEQAELISRYIHFDEHETLAFLDKLWLARSESPDLKKVIIKRLKKTFDAAYGQIQTPLSPGKNPPGNLLFFKMAIWLKSEEPLSLKQISARSGFSESRVQYLIEKMLPYFPIETTPSGNSTRYRMPPENSSYVAREPGSQSLYELGMALRRLASYSLDARYPIHLVDKTEHYVSGSYILPLAEKDISDIAILFSQIAKKMSNLEINLKSSENKKYIGICFDVFDTNI